MTVGFGTDAAVFDKDKMTTTNYEIKIKGYLDRQWSEWLGELVITYDAEGNTLLSGHVPDQAALHGILAQIRDLGLTLVSLSSQSPAHR